MVGKQRISWCFCLIFSDTPPFFVRARNSAERGAREVQCGWAYFGHNLPSCTYHHSANWAPGGLLVLSVPVYDGPLGPVVRFLDKQRNVLVYLVYSDKLVEGSPKNSISTVPIMPWTNPQP